MEKKFNKMLVYFFIYIAGMFFIFYFFITEKELLKTIVLDLFTGVGATFLTFWLVKMRDSKRDNKKH